MNNVIFSEKKTKKYGMNHFQTFLQLCQKSENSIGKFDKNIYLAPEKEIKRNVCLCVRVCVC